jgi:16S rRNA (cytosine1402-N4)-methyltransferase
LTPCPKAIDPKQIGPVEIDAERQEQAMTTHEPVMVQETLDALNLKVGDVVVDGTLGLGGHAERFLSAVQPLGIVYGFDWDASMLEPTDQRLKEKYGNIFHSYRSDYRNIPAILRELSIRPNAAFLDLGLNSAQIQDSSRGISFKSEGPLDMRMDRSAGEPASALLNRLSPNEIETILWNFGDERWAKAIARQICERRKTAPLKTTRDLVDAVLAAIPTKARDTRIHPATRTFQAVRIAVNHELDGLQAAFEEIADTLSMNGTLAILSYHSGEDQAAKLAFRALSETGSFENLYKKPVRPTPAEVEANPRSRSAKLRALQRRKF